MNRLFALVALVLSATNGAGSPAPTTTLNNPSQSAGDEFGRAVAVAGTRIVIGALLDDTGAMDAGAAYVYDLSSGTPTTPAITLTNPSPADFDLFGAAIAMSGPRLVIGAWGAMNGGIAYVYDLSGATPAVPIITLGNPTAAAGDRFGVSVAISGTQVIIGADGEDTGANGAGSAYVYDLAGATPDSPVMTLTNPSPSTFEFESDRFGDSVAISGARVVVGAPGDEGPGVTATGIAYVYDLASGTPTTPVATLNNPSPVAGDEFGIAVAIDGTRVVIGGEECEEVYIYDVASAMPGTPIMILTNPTPVVGEHFGISVAISGTRIVVGADDDNIGPNEAGSIYVYDLSSARPAGPVATVNNPSPAEGDDFGRSVAVDGVTIVAGAPRDDAEAVDGGTAYVFKIGPTMRMVAESPGVLKLSWTPADRNFVLQCANRLAPDRWIDYGTGSTMPVTILTTNQLPFYRLVAPSVGLVINEVDYDQPGTDTNEFVELLNRSSTTCDLSQHAVVFINGATSTEYARVTLSGTLAPGEYLLIVSTNLTGVPAGVRRIDFALGENNIQNGAPDGIALVNLGSLQVVDALSYEGSINMATINGFPGRYSLVEGTPLPASVQDSNTAPGSLGRNPNGQDANDAASDWRFSSGPTPGMANQ